MSIKHVAYCLLLSCVVACESPTNTTAYSVGFYNVENLFDTIDDPLTNDNSFLPKSRRKWTSERYFHKQEQLSKVIFHLDSTYHTAIIGLAEIENRAVLADLLIRPSLRDLPYEIIHQDSPDERGIDVAAIYNKDIFNYEEHNYVSIELNDKNKGATRDILLVTGTIENQQCTFIFSHWPSRSGGQTKSDPARKKVASFIYLIAKKIHTDYPKREIIVLGDFNDTPTNASVFKELGADTLLNASTFFYNTAYKQAIEGKGSYYYKGQFSMLDNAVVLQNMLNSKNALFTIATPPFLCFKTQSGKLVPNRTYSGIKYFGGFSDHFPIVISVLPK